MEDGEIEAAPAAATVAYVFEPDWSHPPTLMSHAEAEGGTGNVFRSVKWSPDGTRLLCVSEDNVVRIMSLCVEQCRDLATHTVIAETLLLPCRLWSLSR